MTRASRTIIVVAVAAAGVLLWVGTSSLAQNGAAERPLVTGQRVDRILVHKGTHWLVAYWRGAEVARYRSATGMGGRGPKRFEGDLTTPEGTYRIDRRHRSEQFHRFLHVSYPNAEDRARFRQLRRAGDVPEGRGIGSAIGIHGQPRTLSVPYNVNWTAGCIAVSDEAAAALYRAVIPNAELVID